MFTRLLDKKAVMREFDLVVERQRAQISCLKMKICLPSGDIAEIQGPKKNKIIKLFSRILQFSLTKFFF